MSLSEQRDSSSAGTPALPDPHTDSRASSPFRARLTSWIAALSQNPTADLEAAEERRALLLAELNRTVAEAPDDVPIKYVINQLNRHWDD
jgi:hypothetical protein